MASQKKIRKLKNSRCSKSALKEKECKLKRALFFTSSARRQNNKISETED